jgi:hypothetical protein
MSDSGADNGEIDLVVVGGEAQRLRRSGGVAQVEQEGEHARAARFAGMSEALQLCHVPAVQEQRSTGAGVAPRQRGTDPTGCARDEDRLGILPGGLARSHRDQRRCIGRNSHFTAGAR